MPGMVNGRAINDRVLGCLAGMTAEGYGGIRRVVSVEDVARALYGIAEDAPVPGTQNAATALALKDARNLGYASYGSHMRDVNLGYAITVEGEVYLGLRQPKKSLRDRLRRR